jgi:hypothetical protein
MRPRSTVHVRPLRTTVNGTQSRSRWQRRGHFRRSALDGPRLRLFCESRSSRLRPEEVDGIDGKRVTVEKVHSPLIEPEPAGATACPRARGYGRPRDGCHTLATKPPATHACSPGKRRGFCGALLKMPIGLRHMFSQRFATAVGTVSRLSSGTRRSAGGVCRAQCCDPKPRLW